MMTIYVLYSLLVPAFSPTSSDKRKSIELLSKELLQLSSPPSNRRRSSVPVPKEGESLDQTPRRHSAHMEDKKKVIISGEPEQKDDKISTKFLGQLVDQMTLVEPCIIRNSLEYQVRNVQCWSHYCLI